MSAASLAVPAATIVPRLIPSLLIKGGGLVKTRKFRDPEYIGDPVNAVKIFNEKEVDELMVLDIEATRTGQAPRFDLLRDLASEAFMPLSYGGGVRDIATAQRLFTLGFEKVSLNAAAVLDAALVGALADRFGAQAVVVSIDVRRSLLGRYEVVTHGGSVRTGLDPVEHARRVVALGAGELMVTAVDREGTMNGCDLALTRSVADAVGVPVIASGGVGSLTDVSAVLHEGHAHAVAAGAFCVYHGKHRAVLISYPTRASLEQAFRS